MSEQIYIFNPEHDLCIANGDENFVPPRSAVGFAKDNMNLAEHLNRPNKQRRQIIPWGWNHSLKKRLINEGIDPATLPPEEELQFIRTHSRREFALDVHSHLSCVDSDADNYTLEDRNNGVIPVEHVDLAKRIATADRIVISAPFWDMSFPSALKVFFENMSLFGITFDTNDRECYGLCKAEKVMYITSRGMNISTGDPLEQATPYIKALSHLWGWGELTVVAAQNMDYSSTEEIKERIARAIADGLEICKTF